MARTKATQVANPAPATSAVSNVLRKANKAGATKTAKKNHVRLENESTLVDKVAELKQELADLETKYEQTEQQLIDRARVLYDAERQANNYQTAIECEGNKTNGLMVVFADKYLALPVEMEDDLKKVDPKYDQHFLELREIKVKKDAFADKTVSDSTIKLLIDKLGEDKFTEIFDITVKIGTVKGLASIIDSVPTAARGLLTQAKPSVRNLTDEGKVV